MYEMKKAGRYGIGFIDPNTINEETWTYAWYQKEVEKNNNETHARLFTVREAARLMGAPDSFILPGSYNDGYKAMGDAVAMPAAQFIGEQFLTKLAETVYDDSY